MLGSQCWGALEFQPGLSPCQESSPSLQPDKKLLFLDAGKALGGGSGLSWKWRLGRTKKQTKDPYEIRMYVCTCAT